MLSSLQAYLNALSETNTTLVLSQLAHDIKYNKDKTQTKNILSIKPDTTKLNTISRLALASMIEAFFTEENLDVPDWVNDPEFYSDKPLYPTSLIILTKTMKNAEEFLGLARLEAHPICLKRGYIATYPLDVY